MELSVESLQKTAGCFTGPAVLKKIQLKINGNEVEFDVYILKLSYHSLVREISASKHGLDVNAARISACIVDEDGNPQFQMHDITGFYPDGKPVMWKNPETDKEEPRGPFSDRISTALLSAISEVNNLGKDTGSAKKTSSGTSSSSTESAAAPSKKQSKG